MLGLTAGELVVVAFVVIAVVSARWWPRLGELCAEALSKPAADEPGNSAESSGPSSQGK